MARKRMISPEIWDSENFSKLSILARLVFIGMFSNADDEGRGKAKAAFLKSKLFPYDESMRVADVESALDEVAENMSVTMYSHDGNEYYSFDNWKKWQKVDKPSPSNIIPYDSESCNIIRGTFREHSPNVPRTLPPNRIEKKKNRKEDKTTEDNTAPPVAVPQNIIDAFQNNIAPLTPIVMQAIADWLGDVDADMIEWAIREAAEHNKRNWKYIEGILRNHFNAGRTTLSQVQDAQRNFKRHDADLGVYKDDNLDYAELEKIMQEKM